LLEPEPKLFWPGYGGKFLKKFTKTQNFSYLSSKLTLKITISLLFTLKNLLMIIYVFKNHENRRIFHNNMGKIVRAGAGIFDNLEPEPDKNAPAPPH
jgi:hypothetical protein